MLKKKSYSMHFFKVKNFTLLIHTNWHKKPGPSIWLSPMHRDVSSVEYTPQKNVTVAMTVLVCVFLAVGSLAPSILLMYLGVCICDAFFLNLNT